MAIDNNLNEQLAALNARVSLTEIEEQAQQLQQRLAELEHTTSAPDFWTQLNEANNEAVLAELKTVKSELELSTKLSSNLHNLTSAIELLSEIEDNSDQENISSEASSLINSINSLLDNKDVSQLFSGQYDTANAIVSINPGSGGLEANDWCEMLYKMYLGYAKLKGWQVKVISAEANSVIGLESAAFEVSGDKVYGHLKGEQGVHRLVRISPTDDKKRRHTTFAAVEVLPVLSDTDNIIEIADKDIKIDVYRSSGPGGQSVNTTDSAVRITHLPSGLVVTCQNQKSQLQNKEQALRILIARLQDAANEQAHREKEALRGARGEISWGHQIRNYVLYPYQLVKDTRSGCETSQVDNVLSGQLDDFVMAELKRQHASAL